MKKAGGGGGGGGGGCVDADDDDDDDSGSSGAGSSGNGRSNCTTHAKSSGLQRKLSLAVLAQVAFLWFWVFRVLRVFVV